MKNALKILSAVFCCFFVCMLVVHRRVISAMIRKEPLPEPPAWHTWHKKD